MAANLRARRIGRSSHMVNLRVPEGGELLSIEAALNVLKQQIRSDWATLINRRSDTITSARIAIVVADAALSHDYTVAMPAGQAPLGVRDGDGLDNSLGLWRTCASVAAAVPTWARSESKSSSTRARRRMFSRFAL